MRDIKAYKEKTIAELRAKIGDSRVLLALSGGVDSSVCCALLAEAAGEKLNCIFVDHGFMRKHEGDEVEEAFGRMNINFVRVDAAERFLARLKGVTDPEQKRKIIGEEFIRVFEEEAKKLGAVDYFAQGTIYLDVAESGKDGHSAVKAHHNVGGLPDVVDFKEIIEPLRELYKEEVRALGKELGLPDALTQRQPFPGPGLAIRCLGEVSFEKLEILRNADYIFRREVGNAGYEIKGQYFAVITDMRSVGVRNEMRTYEYTVALRAVISTDFMNADFARIPYEILEKVSARITEEAGGVNRVVYDITKKPPGTIEWE